MGEALKPSLMTTPGCITLHRRLRRLCDAGAGQVVTEVSSHALDQDRLSGVRIRIAALTNLSRDHLDYHSDPGSYRAAKARLFHRAHLAAAVINVTDTFGRELATEIGNDMELISVGAASQRSGNIAPRLQYEIIGSGHHGLQIGFSGAYGRLVLRSPLWGDFNAENLAMALGILLAHGIGFREAAAALAVCSAPPGRMQTVCADPARPMVVVDFAHTPDALEKLLGSVRRQCRGVLWLVFGCGGDRDQGKRHAMGRVAVSLADQVLLTTDNPRDESPATIIRQIMEGIGDAAAVEIIEDRAAAIAAAIGSARPDDVVVIAGKGHETAQIIRGRRLAFSDVAVARAALGLTA